MFKPKDEIIKEAERYSTIFATVDDSKKDLFRKKIIELTVKECADLVQSFVDQRIPASEYSTRLKHYFGIEK